jgi:hypothetical protein
MNVIVFTICPFVYTSVLADKYTITSLVFRSELTIDPVSRKLEPAFAMPPLAGGKVWDFHFFDAAPA